MSLLKNPTEISDSLILTGLIYGQPGIGKSTLALSAPNPVMIDADKGMKRVEKRFQVPSLPLNDYRDIPVLFQSPELAPFETVVFDTLGKLVDRMGEYLVAENPKNGKAGGGLSQAGWGALKIEFQKLLKLAQGKNKHIIFVAHEKEEKDGEIRIVRPDVSGSSGKDLVKDLDFMGYMESRGNRRTISFTPTEKFYAKNSLRLPAIIDVPDTEHGNTFIQQYIIEKTIERMKEDDITNRQYLDLMAILNKHVDAAETPETFGLALKSINDAPVIWDSQRAAKVRLNEKAKALGIIYDKDKKAFTQAETKAA